MLPMPLCRRKDNAFASVRKSTCTVQKANLAAPAIKGDRGESRSPVGGELLPWMQDSVSDLGSVSGLGSSCLQRYPVDARFCFGRLRNSRLESLIGLGSS